MAQHSHARTALRSLLPESYLARKHDANALACKYRAALRGNWDERDAAWFTLQHWAPIKPELSTTYRKDKIFDGLGVECNYSPVTASDPDHDVYFYEGSMGITQLHMHGFKGVDHFRGQLAMATEYIRSNPGLEANRYVGGFTYGELGRLAARAGFRRMRVESCEPDYKLRVRSAHMAYCAINDRRAVPFEMAAVYLPTGEFIEKFRDPTGTPLLTGSRAA